MCEIAVRRSTQFIGGAVLVQQPYHLVRMTDEVGWKFRSDHEIDGRAVALTQIDQPPCGRVRENFLLWRPLERHTDELGLISVRAKLLMQRAHEVLGAAVYERHLHLANNDALNGHRRSKAASLYRGRRSCTMQRAFVFATLGRDGGLVVPTVPRRFGRQLHAAHRRGHRRTRPRRARRRALASEMGSTEVRTRRAFPSVSLRADSRSQHVRLRRRDARRREPARVGDRRGTLRATGRMVQGPSRRPEETRHDRARALGRAGRGHRGRRRRVDSARGEPPRIGRVRRRAPCRRPSGRTSGIFPGTVGHRVQRRPARTRRGDWRRPLALECDPVWRRPRPVQARCGSAGVAFARTSASATMCRWSSPSAGSSERRGSNT